MDRKINVIRYLLLVLLLTGVGISCIGIEKVNNVNLVERLRERAGGYLEAQTKMSLNEMEKYYLEPGHVRIGNIVHKGGKIESIEIEADGDKAVVKLKLTMQAMGFTFKDVLRNQYWLWEKGDWYIDPAGAASQSSPFGSKKTPE